MAYSRAWDETAPAGTVLANTLDTVIQNFKTDIRERVAGIWGLNLAQFAADPIVPLSLQLGGPAVLGERLSIKGSNINAETVVIDTPAGQLADIQTWRKNGVVVADITSTGALEIVSISFQIAGGLGVITEPAGGAMSFATGAGGNGNQVFNIAAAGGHFFQYNGVTKHQFGAALSTFTGDVTSLHHNLTGAAGVQKNLRFQTNGNARWLVLSGAQAETGADAGSDFNISAYNDAGVNIDTPVSIVRAAGGVMTFSRPINVTSTIAGVTTLTGTTITISGVMSAGTVVASGGGITSAGSIIQNGAAGDNQISGRIRFINNWSGAVSTGTLFQNAVNGLEVVLPVGSSFDFVMLSSAFSTVMRVPTGTINTAFFGTMAVTGAITATGGVIGNVTGNVTGSAGSVAASALTGNTLAAGVTGSSLTSVGVLASLNTTTLQVAGGGTVSKLLTALLTWDPPLVAGNSFTQTTIAVAGCAIGDAVLVCPKNGTGTTQSFVFDGYVSAAGTVTVTAHNPTAGGIDLPSDDYRIIVMRIA